MVEVFFFWLLFHASNADLGAMILPLVVGCIADAFLKSGPILAREFRLLLGDEGRPIGAGDAS